MQCSAGTVTDSHATQCRHSSRQSRNAAQYSAMQAQFQIFPAMQCNPVLWRHSTTHSCDAVQCGAVQVQYQRDTQYSAGTVPDIPAIQCNAVQCSTDPDSHAMQRSAGTVPAIVTQCSAAPAQFQIFLRCSAMQCSAGTVPASHATQCRHSSR